MKNNYKIMGDVVEIELKDGGRCLIDLDELNKVDEKISTYWYEDQKGYVRGGTPTISMHRLILNTPKGLVVDHINHLKWDNRKKNLRNCTISENSKNRVSDEELISIGAKKDWRPDESQRLLTNQDVMELLNVKRQTLHVYREKKGLPFIRINSRTFRYEREKVLDWLQKQGYSHE